MFFWIKIIHVINAALLFGVGLATAVYYIYMQKDLNDKVKVNKQVGYVDWLFTAVAGVIQPTTGFILIFLKNYPLTTQWWVVVLLGFALAGVCWFPAIYLRSQCLQLAQLAVGQNSQLSSQYYSYYRWRCALSMIAFLVLIVVFYFMANVPQ